MREGIVGAAVLLELSLTDRAVGKFPRVRILDSAGLVVTLVPLVATADAGTYSATWTPGAAGQYTAVMDVYTDAGFTILDVYERVADNIRVRVLEPDTVFQKLLGYSGENVRDDVLSYDLITNRPLTFRRRIFANAAAAAASTPGGTGEGEIATVTGSATHFDAARWETLLRVLGP